MNKKLEKILVKAAIGVPFAVALGVTYRTGKDAEETVDDYYEKKHGVNPKIW